MKKEIILCNTVYQVMVAVWIKHYKLKDSITDIIISDHMNGGEKISETLKEMNIFNKVFYVKSLEEARYRIKRKRILRIAGDIFPSYEIKRYINLEKDYSDLYIANCDGFSQLLYNVMYRNNSNIKLHIYEDGLSTYCEFEKYYNYFKDYYYTDDTKNIIKKFMREILYKKQTIYGNVSEFLVFNPEVMKWDPKCKVNAIKKIDSTDRKYIQLINKIFKYSDTVDRYNEKYIFFEESFFADGEKINDVQLVEELAKVIGKDNIMIKIHPRNPINRFEKLGYKTNKDTSIPWEVILLNIDDVSNKVFLTIASSTILNPIMILGRSITAYSLYPCLDQVPNRLKGEAWEFLKELFETYSDEITLCNSIKDIK